jgi:hypothetical protein
MTNSNDERTSALPPTPWPPVPQLPANYGVRLIFGGLLGFCHNAGKCEVGFYKDDDHQPIIIVSEKPGCDPYQMRVGTGRMTIGITGQSTNSVSFYNPGGGFNRLTGNDWDFRWLIDLHDWCPNGKIKPGYFAPVLDVRHGTFFTLQKSNSTFKRVTLSGTTQVDSYGYQVRFFAADIAVANGQSVTIDTGAETKTLYPSAQRTYEVLITNLCSISSVSDFHLLVEAYAEPGDPLYDLYLDREGTEAEPNFCTADLRSKLIKPVGDDAPCMGAGYGGAGGFPGP